MAQEQKKYPYPEDLASSEDIQRRRIYQFRRFQELSGKNMLTPEWIKFGKNHPEEIRRSAGIESTGEDKKARITPRPLNRRRGGK